MFLGEMALADIIGVVNDLKLSSRKRAGKRDLGGKTRSGRSEL